MAESQAGFDEASDPVCQCMSIRFRTQSVEVVFMEAAHAELWGDLLARFVAFNSFRTMATSLPQQKE